MDFKEEFSDSTRGNSLVSKDVFHGVNIVTALIIRR